MIRITGLGGLAVACVAAVPLLSSVPRTGWAQIEDIVVTTRKREESLQDVPIAVQAIGTEQIERQGISSLEDIVKLAPSVQFDTSFGPADTRVTIRGLSNTRGRSNVAFLVDGVDVTTENLITAGSGLLANRRLLNDVERIELVKGPQSALYGRAAFAGAISYITKEPGPEFGGKFGLDFGEDGQKQIDFAVGGPVKGLEDYLGVRASGVWWDEDGRYVNSVSGGSVGGSNGFGGAFTVVFTPNDVVKVKARVEYTDEDYEPRPNVRIGGGLPLELKPTPNGTQNNSWPSQIFNPGDPGYPSPGTPGYPGAVIPGTDPVQPDPSVPISPALAPVRITTDSDGDGFPDVNRSAYTCEGRSEFLLFPKSALDAQIGVGTAFGTTGLGLQDFGPGFCVPRSFGDAEGLQVAQSEDPFTGEDYAGTTQKTLRASLSAEFDLDIGTITSTTGWTDFEGFDTYDQDYQALGRPDRLLGQQQARAGTDTRQFSQELRFASRFNGPVNFTVGGLYWEEKRVLHDQNFIIFCAPVAKVGGKYGVPTAGPTERRICDGTNGTLDNWQDYARQLPVSAQINAINGFAPIPDTDIAGVFWQADTEHWSAYLAIEWEFAENWKLTFENRYVDEKFTLFKPNHSSCTTAAFAPGGVAFLEKENITNLPQSQDIVCESEVILNPSININLAAPEDWAYVQGSSNSRFHTPKVTIEWTPTDDSLVYFFWAHAQKPGGINQLVAGGFPPPSIDSDRFESEKLDAWEVGSKTSWEAAGFLQLNGSFFFQDYTDKQVTTQVVVGGQLQPVVLNASAAEVWGLELDATWQPDFVDGLTLAAGYTWLDAKFTKFLLESASLVRAAINGQCNVVVRQVFDAGDNAYFQDETCAFDLSGNKLERTPEHSVVLQANLTRPFGQQNFDWFVETNASWQSERFLDEDNSVIFEPYWMVDLRLGLTADNWEVIAYVKNLLDDDTIITGGSGPDFSQQVVETGFTAGFGVSHFFGTLPMPRTAGIRMSYRF